MYICACVLHRFICTHLLAYNNSVLQGSIPEHVIKSHQSRAFNPTPETLNPISSPNPDSYTVEIWLSLPNMSFPKGPNDSKLS